MGKEGAGMKILVPGRVLGQDIPHSDVRGNDLHDELIGRVRMD
jgi:hypothetical protein